MAVCTYHNDVGPVDRLSAIVRLIQKIRRQFREARDSQLGEDEIRHLSTHTKKDLGIYDGR